MNQFSQTYATQSGTDSSFSQDKHDERGSTSGSEDGSSYFNFADASKIDDDMDDDASLTSQTLNADGTPKRPMNAFMIFARRRRPQVSAENQSMRTGEISKILSKEWNSMLPADKQFYLDQAKQLKDTFNSKYPDYIYRRRPNNSRKRRRGDSAGSRHERSPSDGGDDLVGVHELSESPIDRDGSNSDSLSEGGHHLSRRTHDSTQSLGDHHGVHRHNSYPFTSSDPFYRPSGSHENRLSLISASDRLSHNLSSSAALGSPRLSQTSQLNNYTYSSLQSSHHHLQQPQPSSMFDLPLDSAPGAWPMKLDPGRAISSSWMPSSTHRHDLPSISTSPLGQRIGSPVSSWSTSAPSASATDGTASAALFPTLNTPYYPSSSSPSASYNTTPSTASSSASQAPFGVDSSMSQGHHTINISGRRSYDLGVPSYAPSSQSQQYPLGNRDSPLPVFPPTISARHSFSGAAGLPRANVLPTMPSISSASSSSLGGGQNIFGAASDASSHHLGNVSAFWQRDKIQGC